MGNAWKALERDVAKTLRGERVLRGGDFSKKDVDVRVGDFESLQIDAKYRQRWAHHRFLDEVERKYCDTKAGHMPILVTKHPRQRGACVTLRLEHFGCILDVVRELREENEALRKRKG